ncbi:DUF72 domain-containing protein [Lacticaseibacillus saniviri]|uniref:Uracil-xanthine permease n=1 Tax=Lacticaseibacillus saniviri JCM 17471 = DSM 24301 TaxID=1293598 RepID=A0A0R2MZB4_9LACO|nr:DUF72 domain-containing protein [Lacticaseibacillus saniviri]KRO18919.1 uracil-xanthine permease [Lacticaseibacillus saniviri JCM 17471 = DSM 24301]MCG4280937.1 DUF72 domain-containing protein [Lacticaseibacillus saniviri]
MIDVGLTSVAEHPQLSATGKSTSTLVDYAQYFPVVELDTTFYGLKSPDVVRRWQEQVPPQFQFIVKATGMMTGQTKMDEDSPTLPEQFQALESSLQPLIQSKQLRAILFQMPPFFGVNQKSVRYLRLVRQLYPTLPVAIEFRHDSWYSDVYRQSTLDLLQHLNFIHVVVDEPQTVSGSVPLVPVATNSELTIMRLHGHNLVGWANRSAQWRKERTNYRYATDELTHLGEIAQQLTSKQVTVIFNNNGGGDAADNALQFIDLLGLHFDHLGPRQMGLF